MTGGEPVGGREPQRSRREIAGLVAAGALLVLFLLFIFDNRRDVKVGLVLTDRELPLIAVMVISALAGAAFTALVSWRRRR